MKNEVNIINELRKEIIIKQRKHDHSMSGKTGYCFIKGDKIIKIYEHPKLYSSDYDMTKFKSKRISFPMDYMYERGAIIGEVLPYYNIDSINKSFNSLDNIDYMIDAYQDIEQEIRRYPFIAMYDICKENILYSNSKGLFLIDTTDWVKEEESYIEYNLMLLERSILIALKDIIIKNNYKKINGETLLKYFYEYIGDGNNILDLLREYHDTKKINCNYEKKYLKIMKKR